MIMVLGAESFWRLAPNIVRRMRKRFYSPAVALIVCLYVLGAHFWRVTYVHRLAVSANPVAFASSLFHRPIPRVDEVIPAGYLSIFSGRSEKGRGDYPSHFQAVTQLGLSSSQRPMNVLMIVMESVGAGRLQLYGASYKDSPEMVQLAGHGFNF